MSSAHTLPAAVTVADVVEVLRLTRLHWFCRAPYPVSDVERLLEQLGAPVVADAHYGRNASDAGKGAV